MQVIGIGELLMHVQQRSGFRSGTHVHAYVCRHSINSIDSMHFAYGTSYRSVCLTDLLKGYHTITAERLSHHYSDFRITCPGDVWAVMDYWVVVVEGQTFGT